MRKLIDLKKVITAGLLTVMAAGIMAGCSSEKSPASETEAPTSETVVESETEQEPEPEQEYPEFSIEAIEALRK